MSLEPITIRRMRFEFPAELDPVFIEGEPEESYVNVSMSLLLPYLEPYLIRTMTAAKAKVTDPVLREQLEGFIGQEGQHYREHAKFNEALRAKGFTSVAPLEQALEEDYRRFAKTRSLRFNLAYAEGFEAMTTAMALVFVGLDRSKWDPRALDLFSWHLMEELEHRTVAFDVYHHVAGGYFYRVGVGLYAQAHLMRFLIRATLAMVADSSERLEQLGGKRAHKQRWNALNLRVLPRLLPKVLRTYLPWYHPRRIEMPPVVRQWRERFSREATSTRGCP